ncbi:TetR/AcrR family transcriptional regulator [Planomonospora venezuelensis]|uniref:AcrR family transcriptional regulator n=1 Tax=Planomonospora venezuelensis TaxID=1999 RepID=A0A841CZ88_PLAVE|nr:TetR/AcrR family transcriptional regulator [Planomonospora venezuelensis]MBB5961428.1 AcrR family transcriptional regulator [Planomonospora venezuelensis]GIN03174.1 TetR family transcriptional regulator [Planomonospora venezuelensis]
MSNRDDLLAGARRCLLEKGYARTTARDIALAAGVSLAAIGYHFGTKEALLNEALTQALEEWGDSVEQAPAAGSDADPAERFEATWDGVVRSFADDRSLWAVQFELLAHIHGNPGLRHTFAEANRAARLGLVELFGLSVPRDQEERLGAHLQMLVAGAAAQWLMDPESVPSGSDLRRSALALVAALGR